MNGLGDKLKSAGVKVPTTLPFKIETEPHLVEKSTHFCDNALIELNFNGKSTNPKHQYSVNDNVVDSILEKLESLDFVDMVYIPAELDKRDSILIQIDNHSLYCSTQKDRVLYVFGIEVTKTKVQLETVKIKNIFEINQGSQYSKTFNPHLQYLYYILDVKKAYMNYSDLETVGNNIPLSVIPIVFNSSDKMRKEDIYYVTQYLETKEFIELKSTDDQDDQHLYFYLEKYKLKALVSRNNNHIYIFNITLIQDGEQSEYSVRSNVFTISHGQSIVDNGIANQHLLNLCESLHCSNGSEMPKEECFATAKDFSIELNMKAPKNYTYQDNELINQLTKETLQLFQHKTNRNRAVLFSSSLKIKCSIHDTNFNVTDELMKDVNSKPKFEDFDSCFVKGSVFRITKGDQKTKRKVNQHLVHFLRANKVEKKEILPIISTPKFKFTPALTEYNFKNIILSGVAGVGKTHSYEKLINLIESGTNETELFKELINNQPFTSKVSKDRIEFITFHQNYSYEEFIEGFRPNQDNGISIEDGLFKEFVQKAQLDRERNYYFVIDEINRGNISKIFGELITLIEDSKRDELSARLPYSKQPFMIPKNLFIIGTMNITDQSISKIDIALRRRFIFINIEPNSNLVCEQFRDTFIDLNQFISNNLGDDYLIGHSYFMKCNDKNLNFILNHQIKPLLQDYFYGDKESLNEIEKILGLTKDKGLIK